MRVHDALEAVALADSARCAEGAPVGQSFVDAGDYAASWNRAAALFKATVTQDARVKQIVAALASHGKLVSRRLRARTATERLPGQPDGKYVVLEYDTVFERHASAIETVTPMVDPDGTWRVVGYFIR